MSHDNWQVFMTDFNISSHPCCFITLEYFITEASVFFLGIEQFNFALTVHFGVDHLVEVLLRHYLFSS